ncbi:MAG: ABC transporter permease [Burkholderiales bacterium]|nr:ABC transporter permease [Burkholderiales bacterium]
MDARFNRTLRFAADACIGVLSPSTYNSATREVVLRQIYFTAWQVLPGFAAFAAVASFLIIQIVGNTARNFGLYEYALELVVRLLVLEILPLTTALFVALRTGAAINTEVALMAIHRELTALRQLGIDPLKLELIPRVIGGTVSVMALTSVSVVIALALAHVQVVDFQPWNVAGGEFGLVIGRVLGPVELATLFVKTLAFGIAVTTIPIAAGLGAGRELFRAPVAVMQGMVRTFFALMLIECVAVAVLYA